MVDETILNALIAEWTDAVNADDIDTALRIQGQLESLTTTGTDEKPNTD